ncbi:hypothetical protein JCGZ_07164 [Jatropha curcas]|uniref:Uncharacterized protein n=1 Tax=Jatropha curcas TaxID=180498 RepID=A0A067KF13_JATCU|nr:uncharacterized protein LOC105637638 [Jatropha curcas]KDP33593.1 hypothetical protein JCGZ_07164 [Jatropha curcas]
MLLRSTSTPLLKTYVCQLSTPEPDPGSPRPVSLSLERTSSDGELKLLSLVREKMLTKSPARSGRAVVFKEEKSVCMETASSLLSDSSRSVALDDIEEEERMVSDGGDGLGNGGGSGGAGTRNAGDGFWDLSHERMDNYYQIMIETYPGDALLLANYAKFLKEVRGDNVKAEKVCEKALMANARDGDVLSMYGDLIWNNHKDNARAQTYFDEAVQSSPDDCYVLASYARFLWDAGEEEEEKEIQLSNLSTCAPSHNNLSQGYAHLAAASS